MQEFLAVLCLASSEVPALHADALALVRTGNIAGARGILDRVRALSPGSAYCDLIDGHCHLKADRARAEALYRRAVERARAQACAEDNSSGDGGAAVADALHATARLLRVQERWAKAADAYAAALAIRPSNPDLAHEAGFASAKAAFAAGRVADAAAALTAALGNADGGVWAPHLHRELAHACGLLGDASAAAEHYGMAIQLGGFPGGQMAMGEAMAALAAHHESSHATLGVDPRCAISVCDPAHSYLPAPAYHIGIRLHAYSPPPPQSILLNILLVLPLGIRAGALLSSSRQVAADCLRRAADAYARELHAAIAAAGASDAMGQRVATLPHASHGAQLHATAEAVAAVAVAAANRTAEASYRLGRTLEALCGLGEPSEASPAVAAAVAGLRRAGIQEGAMEALCGLGEPFGASPAVAAAVAGLGGLNIPQGAPTDSTRAMDRLQIARDNAGDRLPIGREHAEIGSEISRESAEVQLQIAGAIGEDRLQIARELFQHAVALRPSHAASHESLGRNLLGASRLCNYGAEAPGALNAEQAETYLRTALRLAVGEEGVNGVKIEGVNGREAEGVNGLEAESVNGLQRLLDAVKATRSEVELWERIVQAECGRGGEGELPAPPSADGLPDQTYQHEHRKTAAAVQAESGGSGEGALHVPLSVDGLADQTHPHAGSRTAAAAQGEGGREGNCASPEAAVVVPSQTQPHAGDTTAASWHPSVLRRASEVPRVTVRTAADFEAVLRRGEPAVLLGLQQEFAPREAWTTDALRQAFGSCPVKVYSLSPP
jgi:tetratricopeptide (TPR) repeat protein